MKSKAELLSGVFLLFFRDFPQCGADVPRRDRSQEPARLSGSCSQYPHLSWSLHRSGPGALRTAGKGINLAKDALSNSAEMFQ